MCQRFSPSPKRARAAAVKPIKGVVEAIHRCLPVHPRVQLVEFPPEALMSGLIKGHVMRFFPVWSPMPVRGFLSRGVIDVRMKREDAHDMGLLMMNMPGYQTL
jgi:hypothetical protein